jgi:hypothetical protein
MIEGSDEIVSHRQMAKKRRSELAANARKKRIATA